MTLIYSLFRAGRGCIPTLTNQAPKLFFSTSAPLLKIVGSPAQKGKVAYRVRKARAAEQLRVHPAARKIKDPDQLRAITRIGDYIIKFEYRLFHQLRRDPAYHPYVELDDAPLEVHTEGAIRRSLLGRDIYEAGEILARNCFKHLSFDFRQSLYTQLWQESVHSTPRDLTQVLVLISTWIRIGIRPCNLFSEAIRLLPTNITRETVVLCAFYKALSHKKSLPADGAIFPILETFLHDHGSELTLTELVMISDAFFRSFMPFQQSDLDLCHVVKARFLELLPTTPWTLDAHHIFKLLKLNSHWNRAQLRALGPALTASGFFDFCRQFPRHGIHELMILGEYLASRKFRDEALLSQCVGTLRELMEQEDAYEARCKDYSRLFYAWATLDVELDEETVNFGADFFRQNSRQKPLVGRSLLILLEALTLQGIFPHDLIHALFSNPDLMRVENGSMTGFEFDQVEQSRPPFIELLRLDLCVGLLCPDYRGARLPEEVRRRV